MKEQGFPEETGRLNERAALLALMSVPGLGVQKIRKLVSCFGTPEEVLEAAMTDLCGVKGIDRETAEAVCRGGDRAFVESQIEAVSGTDTETVSLWDPAYPENLKQIHDPPVLLFMRGKLLPEDSGAVAVVGTRSPTTYGKSIAGYLARELALYGATVVSGMARGIDSAAHRGALEAGGRTLAVLGSGVDVVYPPENRKLYEKIIDSGAVLSEFPMGMEPAPGSFPRRNRVISGLARGTVVVEAGLKSGALITANCALEQGREVFAVPGPVGNPYSKGPHRLIQDGAKLVENAEDILSELPRFETAQKQREISIVLTEKEKKVYEVLSNEPQHIDAISALAELTTAEALSLLLTLELKRMVKQSAGTMFTREIQ